MKRILITGAKSYIGTSFEKWVSKYPEKYSVVTIDMKGDIWKKKDFSHYDVIFHVAGIAHVSNNPKMEELYYKVNQELAVQTAKKAKQEGVKQFIFMSSIIVYGDSSSIKTKRVITKETLPKPTNFYGNSKLQAEKGIKQLEDESFKIVILRPPMIYGNGSKGNYPKLASYAKKLPVFPDIDNERSMLHIDNLCEFIRLMVENEEYGVFFPQNEEYVKTSEMVRLVAEVHGKKIKLTKIFNPILYLMSKFIGSINKAFGNLVYEQSIARYKENYRIRNFKESIQLTESVRENS
ncbi:NAD-dependent epimerase/dehydratase family protein [Acetobacterium woodii]|uniref:Putative NAD-dependent epimerase/dehydratase n=1 Tax=Acetobacterium woodii (strain ATCC 29683 / DSM 1030 / JCM 2381 / KCTC 1655 / WB1) TaxID=931626 RepID=H6LBC6_ACEWD|nr:NAD-dependent epimerase/dehydratase family protein [Acetobacterium woodii]AFA48881.1 putative NAD-dependent epimerase/dehydratase [Acetobacterium woodii DSM 1030]